MFTLPDNQPIYENSDDNQFTFFSSGGAKIFGMPTRPMIVENSSTARNLVNFDADRTAKARLDTFLSQRVLCLQGIWISRADVIKYMANIASGVHSGSAIDDTERAITHIRRGMTYTLTEQNTISAEFDISTERDLSSVPDFNYSPNTLDPVLIELLSTVHFLLMSEDTKKLESIIKNEFGVT